MVVIELDDDDCFGNVDIFLKIGGKSQELTPHVRNRDFNEMATFLENIFHSALVQFVTNFKRIGPFQMNE